MNGAVPIHGNHFDFSSLLKNSTNMPTCYRIGLGIVISIRNSFDEVDTPRTPTPVR